MWPRYNAQMNPAGRCFSFDDYTNGYVRGEASISLFLQPYAERVDGDLVVTNEDAHTYGQIVGLASNSMAPVLEKPGFFTAIVGPLRPGSRFSNEFQIVRNKYLEDQIFYPDRDFCTSGAGQVLGPDGKGAGYNWYVDMSSEKKEQSWAVTFERRFTDEHGKSEVRLVTWCRHDSEKPPDQGSAGA